MASSSDVYSPSPLETVFGWVPGHEPAVVIRKEQRVRRSPARALALCIEPHLKHSPLYVAFSGGRDSSCILATATWLAREAGFPDPIPLTLRYPGLPETDEDMWQERVIDHLKLRDWRRINIQDENTVDGPNAQSVMQAYGPYFPYAAHTSLPLARAAGGGTVLTGEGGDLVTTPARTWALANAAARRGRIGAAGWRQAGRDAAPFFMRRRWSRRRSLMQRPWLTREGQRATAQLLSNDAKSEPLSWRRHVNSVPLLRAIAGGLCTIDAVYQLAGARVVHPLLETEVIAALAGTFGPLGPCSRTEAMSALAGGLLPIEVLSRRSKADFTRALIGDDTRALLARWTGQGVDSRLVRADMLQAAWTSSPRPPVNTFQMLLSATYAMLLTPEEVP